MAWTEWPLPPWSAYPLTSFPQSLRAGQYCLFPGVTDPNWNRVCTLAWLGICLMGG